MIHQRRCPFCRISFTPPRGRVKHCSRRCAILKRWHKSLAEYQRQNRPRITPLKPGGRGRLSEQRQQSVWRFLTDLERGGITPPHSITLTAEACGVTEKSVLAVADKGINEDWEIPGEE